MRRWHLCERWWARNYSCVYHQLPDEGVDHRREGEPSEPDPPGGSLPLPLVGERRVPVGQDVAVETVEPLQFPLPVPRVLPEAAISFEPASSIPFIPVPVPEGAVDLGGGYRPPAPVSGPTLVEGVTPFRVPSDPLGGSAQTTPAMIGALGGSGFSVDPSDAARAAGIAIAAVIVIAALSRGVPAPVVRAAAAAVGVPSLFPTILGTAERALVESIEDSIQPTLMALSLGARRDESRLYGQAPFTDAPALRGPRPPLLFNSAARMAELMQGVTRNTDF